MRAAALVVALLAAAPASSVAQQVSGVAIFEHGIYTAEVTGTERLQSGIVLNNLANLCHVATTTTIPAIQGLHFGFRYLVNGPEPGPVTLLRVTRYPGVMKRPTLQPTTIDEYPITQQIGSSSYAGYSFDHPWEFLPGTWTFQIVHGERKLAELSFLVVDGTGVSVPQSGRGDCFRVSSL